MKKIILKRNRNAEEKNVPFFYWDEENHVASLVGILNDEPEIRISGKNGFESSKVPLVHYEKYYKKGNSKKFREDVKILYKMYLNENVELED